MDFRLGRNLKSDKSPIFGQCFSRFAPSDG
jgi:hypothetical protein